MSFVFVRVTGQAGKGKQKNFDDVAVVPEQRDRATDATECSSVVMWTFASVATRAKAGHKRRLQRLAAAEVRTRSSSADVVEGCLHRRRA